MYVCIWPLQSKRQNTVIISLKIHGKLRHNASDNTSHKQTKTYNELSLTVTLCALLQTNVGTVVYL